MGKYKTKTIIDISSEEFERRMDEFSENLDGKIKQIFLHNAPESKVAFVDDHGNKGQVYYNHYEAVIIYKPAKHITKKGIIDKYKKLKNKKVVRNKSKKLDKILA